MASNSVRQTNAFSRWIVEGVAFTIAGVFVDYLLVEGSQKNCELLLEYLKRKFPTTSLGDCTWFYERNIERIAELDTIKSSHETYIESVMAGFDVQST